MKQRLTIRCIFAGLALLLFIAVAMLGFIYDLLPVGIVGVFMALVFAWVFAGCIYIEVVRERFTARYRALDYVGAKAVLDQATHNHVLYPFMRLALNQMYLRVELCLDDIPAAVKYVESLRHVGGAGWRYKTAYFVVLFNLDWSDLAAARTEYEAFKNDCAHHEIYQGQLSILAAIFSHIDGHGVELPESVKNADYPILRRIVRKYC